MAKGNWNDTWRKIVERSWSDARLRQDLIDNPNKVLAAEGIAIPAGVHFVVVENEPNRLHLVLPARPESGGGIPEAGESALSQYNAAVGF